ncbi:hypothetical protein AMS59_22675 [Lysinibacillus sp. FJAT-14745]|uniref:hypothetical protein n=1 Tax=Lysinibacillus sp. FJAT-14745 TaxID=1704289 RepID=UPI0006AB8273|nr:hypothetical protein [Lysinibacillus sp. FJAT-14745]KOP69726.1 hypothetical protein AMS59_22675 [Lysinibacillus sp. FJAT-14745]
MEPFDKLIIDNKIFEYNGGFAAVDSICFVINIDASDMKELVKIVKGELAEIKNVKVYFQDKIIYSSSNTFEMNQSDIYEAEFLKVD